MMPPQIYPPSLALMTDLYQLTMAFGYWKLGLAEKEAAFHLTFRQNPFQGGFALACGLQSAIEYLQRLRFTAEDTAYLSTLSGDDGRPLFEAGFFDYLQALSFTCDLDALPEGTVAFAHEPLLRVTGPLLQAQLLETPLLHLIGFQTLVATKAARICFAARGEPVLEFGLRRAQGGDGGLAAARAAYLGGCDATSNVLAGKIFGIPVKGTHAHSWVMAFDNEAESFAAYAQVLPNNCVFLVDTYDTLTGVRHAVEAGKKLRAHGHELAGIRLDSGDLAYLSIQARKILDENGFPNAAIIATNELDENIIASLKDQGAAVNVWGVGTKLVTADAQPALGCVYKLSALRERGKKWEHKLKLSEQTLKVSTPGLLQVRRFSTPAGPAGDMIYDEQTEIAQPPVIIDPSDPLRHKALPQDARQEDLLAPVFRGGKCVYEAVPLAASRRHAREQLAGFPNGIKRFVNPHQYPAGLEKNLHALKTRLIEAGHRVNGPAGK